MAMELDAYGAWKDWRPEEFGKFAPEDARYFEVELARAGIAVDNGTRILELGFGNGKFTGWARARGADYRGTELSERLVALARENGIAAFPATLDLATVLAEARYDCVIAFDVMEHLSVEEIARLLQAVRDALKPGGRFLARVPSGDSPFAGAIQHGDITHRSVIGSGMMRQLAAQSGLDVAGIREPALPMSGMGIRRLLRRSLVTLTRVVIAKVLTMAFYDNQPRVMTPNMLVILERPAA